MCCRYVDVLSVGVLLMCRPYVGVLSVCLCVVGELWVCCWYVVGVLFRCVVGVLMVFGVIYNCHNALWHFWGHLQVPQCVVAIIQHPERVVAEHLCHNPFCTFMGNQNAFWQFYS